MNLELLKKYKIYFIAAISALVLFVAVFALYFSFKPKEQPKVQKEEKMIYFDVDSQKAPSIPKSKKEVESSSQESADEIDESDLEVDKYNQEMYDILEEPKSDVHIPQEETPADMQNDDNSEPCNEDKSCPVDSSASPPCKKDVYKGTKKDDSSFKRPSLLKPSLKKQKPSLKKKVSQKAPSAPKAMEQRPTYDKKDSSENSPPASAQKIITKINLDYSDARLLSKFINKNVRTSLSSPNRSGQIVLVGTKQEIKVAKQIVKLLDTCPKVQIFKLNYTTPVRMANMLANSVFGGNCCICPDGCKYQKHTSPFVIYYNDDKNTLTLVGASPKQMDMAQRFINFTDVQMPQAFLDILFVEFNDFGISQFNKLAQFHIAKTDCDFGISHKCLYSSIMGIICNGGGKVLSKPSLTISNNGNYNISSETFTPHNCCGSNVCDLAYDCGTHLKIHSVINQKGEVFLSLEPQFVSLKTVAKSDLHPDGVMFQKRSMRLDNVMLKDGETLCFGGIKTQTEHKPPLKRNYITESELMMFVNVHLQN